MSDETERKTPLYRWDITVLRYSEYGDKVVQRTPMTTLGSTQAEVTGKVHEVFESTYDSFRKFWSHGWSLNSVEEVPPQ